MAKNQTRYKSLNVINDDPRINQAFDEGEDGIWVWLETGWTADPRGAHDIHEWKVRDVLRCYRAIVPCDCDSCKGIPSPIGQ
jgi:hypothetical protein